MLWRSGKLTKPEDCVFYAHRAAVHLAMQPAPMRISAEQFFEAFDKEWAGA